MKCVLLYAFVGVQNNCQNTNSMTNKILKKCNSVVLRQNSTVCQFCI